MVSDGEDKKACVEARKVSSCFKTKTGVGTGYDDGLTGEVVSGSWEGDEELGIEEGGKPTHVIDWSVIKNLRIDQVVQIDSISLLQSLLEAKCLIKLEVNERVE